jgi:hypothetical protein
MTRTPEGEVKKHIRAFLEYIGAFVFMPVTSGFGDQAVDFLGCWRGLFFAIEAKAPGRLKKLTDRQRDFLLNVAKAGGIGICVDSVDLLAQWWMEICKSLSIETPDICCTTGQNLLNRLGFHAKRSSPDVSSTSKTISASRSRCPISNDSTQPGYQFPLPLKRLDTTGPDG